jgi:maltose O-acetyltransferase
MKTEKAKMLAGELYDPLDPELSRERQRCRDLCKRLNASREDQQEERRRILDDLFGYPTDAWIQPPFFCDYGSTSPSARRSFSISTVSCLTLCAWTSAETFSLGHPSRSIPPPIPSAQPSGADGICPGVTIGDRSVIGAGSVVTRPIPADVFAAGNPCRVIRPLNEPK